MASVRKMPNKSLYTQVFIGFAPPQKNPLNEVLSVVETTLFQSMN